MWLLKLQTFANSLLWHIRRGLPKSTQQQINYRYNICIECDKFDRHNSACSICGCNISKKKRFLNKLAWADQECPVGKWNKIL